MKIILSCAVVMSVAASSFGVDRVELVTNLSRSGEGPAGKMIFASDGKFYGTTKNGGTSNFGSIFKFDSATGTISTLASFGSTTGRFPNSELLDAGDGYLYGTAKQGGSALLIDDPATTTDERNGLGTIFRVKLSDGTLTKLAQFDGTNSGKFPLGGLVKVGSRFYGAASEGGASDCGTIYKLTPVSGTTNWDVGAFAVFGGTSNGKKPWGTLVDSGGGTLLGTAEFGGSASDKGCVFRITTTATTTGTLQVIKTFSGGATDGANPRAGLWKSKADGFFYGTTYAGGSTNLGTVYRIDALGADPKLVAYMEAAKGSKPLGALVEPPVADGFLYGTCSEGGANSVGSVFKVAREAEATSINSTNLASFNTTDGKSPLAGLTFAPDGLAYGTTEQGGVSGLGAIFRITPGVSLRSVVSFVSNSGSFLRAALTAAPDGSMIGTSFDGGSNGDGSVFRLAPDGTFSPIASFTGPDGANPYGSVVALADGTLYGTTYKGGSSERGTFYRITADGTVQPLIKFGGAVTAPLGTNPRGALVRSGNDFFGVTEKGGANDKGTIFKITVSPIGSTVPATLTTLLEFSGTTGEFPYGGLTDGGDGFFYGTTIKGGANGFGTFFKINAAAAHTKLYDFTSANPTPSSTLVKAASGAVFYGTSDPTSVEPASGTGSGTVFQLSSSTLTTLYAFTGNTATDGRGPRGLALIASSSLAGVTYGGGGTLFTIPTAGGTPTTVYHFADDFSGELKASRPEAAPTLGLDGAIYGVSQKSSLGGGSIFRLLNGPTTAITSVTETSPSSAIARGIVNLNGDTASIFFEYSTASNFSPLSTTLPQELSGTTAQSISADLVNLTPGALYYVRMKTGTRTSRTFAFGSPTSSTGASSSIGARVSTIHGAVNPNGRETSAQIQYGTSISYGSTLSLGSIGNGSSPVVLQATLTSLQPNTVYHYRIAANNAAGTHNGPDALFTTGANSAPTAPNLYGASTSLKNDILIAIPPNLDPDGETLTLTIENQPSFGLATTVGNGVIRYTPNASYKGHDTFTYAVTDPGQAKAKGTVTVRNPFASLKGAYLTYLTNLAGEPVGSLKLTLTTTGTFTGSLSFGGTFSVKGTIDPITGSRSGTPTITIARKGKPSLVLTLHIDTESDTGTLSGSLDDGTNTSQILDDSHLVATKTSPLAGKYTVWLRPPTAPEPPQGNGWATLAISTTGACKMIGKTGDGPPFSTSPVLRTTDSILANIPLFTTQPAAGRGYLFGKLSFKDKPGTDADGSFLWKRGPQPKSLYYPLGFGPSTVIAVASRVAPITALPGIHQITLTDGGLADNATNFPASFTFGPPNSSGIAPAIISSLNTPETVKFSANFKLGTFTGTFVHPDVGAKTPRPFSGILFQKQITGVGVFLGTTTRGAAGLDLQ